MKKRYRDKMMRSRRVSNKEAKNGHSSDDPQAPVPLAGEGAEVPSRTQEGTLAYAGGDKKTNPGRDVTEIGPDGRVNHVLEVQDGFIDVRGIFARADALIAKRLREQGNVGN